MKIIPAIDVKGGKCVRLFKGDFDKVTEYSSDPSAVSQRFSAMDVQDLHVVDLDGARSGHQDNQAAIAKITEQSNIDVQLGGGIRERSDVIRCLESGVRRCVVGSVAIKSPATVKTWIKEFGADRIILALDVNLADSEIPMLSTDGWTRESVVSLWDCVDDYRDVGVQHVLCTDIARDGAMTGPNLDLYAKVLRRYPDLQLQASGGVRDIDDLTALKNLGVPGAITGRALLDGTITAAEVASFRRNA